jgi:hypothetical protein
MHPEAKKGVSGRESRSQKSGFLSFPLLAAVVLKINFGFWDGFGT